jgi:hypothetical protein
MVWSSFCVNFFKARFAAGLDTMTTVPIAILYYSRTSY